MAWQASRGIRKWTISEGEKILHKLGGLYAKCTIDATTSKLSFFGDVIIYEIATFQLQPHKTSASRDIRVSSKLL